MTIGAFFEDLSIGQTATLKPAYVVGDERVIEGEAHMRVPSRT